MGSQPIPRGAGPLLMDLKGQEVTLMMRAGRRSLPGMKVVGRFVVFLLDHRLDQRAGARLWGVPLFQPRGGTEPMVDYD